jgi:hypothetical protein
MYSFLTNMQLLTAKNRCILDEKQFSLKKLKKCIFSKMQVCTCIYYKRNIYYINLYMCIISTHLTGRYWTIGDVTFGKNDNRTQSQFFEQKMAAVKTAGADYLESLPNTIIKRLCIYLYVCMHLNMYIYIYIMWVCVCLPFTCSFFSSWSTHVYPGKLLFAEHSFVEASDTQRLCHNCQGFVI